MLTREQKARYLANGGLRCPYCDSADIDAGEFDGDGDESWQRVRCSSCDAEWVDIYKLTDIEDA